jgi:hypothetical protein
LVSVPGFQLHAARLWSHLDAAASTPFDDD